MMMDDVNGESKDCNFEYRRYESFDIAQQAFVPEMASLAASRRPTQPLRFPSPPVITQRLSSTQATSTFTTNKHSCDSPSPALKALSKVSNKLLQPEVPANTSSNMARDNGKRGSYRHVSGSMAKVSTSARLFHPFRPITEFLLKSQTLLTDGSLFEGDGRPHRARAHQPRREQSHR